MKLQNYEHKRLKRIADLCDHGMVLDIGYSQLPNPYFRGVYRVGVDLNEPPDGIQYEETHVGSALELESCVGDRRFDYIVAGEFIEHLEEPYSFLRYIQRFLQPNGQLILSTPNPVGFPLILFEWMGTGKYFYTTDHTYLYPPRWMERILRRSGYNSIKQISVGVWMPWMVLPCPTAMSYQIIYVAQALAD